MSSKLKENGFWGSKSLNNLYSKKTSLLNRRRFLTLLGLGATGGSFLPNINVFAKSKGFSIPAFSSFKTPALINDFPEDPSLQKKLNDAWNINCNGWTEQAILGNPWTVSNAQNQTDYFNPLTTDISEDQKVQAMITWPAFPNRIRFYYENNPYPFYYDSVSNKDADSSNGLNAQQQIEMAELGSVNGQVMGNVLADCACDPYSQNSSPVPPLKSGGEGNETYACGGSSDTASAPYAPYGPRGWLDEYCEMARELNAEGKIIKVHFTCENPEYWHTLWNVQPEKVLYLYQSILQNDNIRLEDLYLYETDETGSKKVIDPSTNRPAYNPLNKWNSGMNLFHNQDEVFANAGTLMTKEAGGAVHLTSTPNTLQTELQLASGATIQRNIESGNFNGSTLICCAEYGQIFRNSDPHIGQLDNQVVGAGYQVTLANPIGLYIQMPDFSTWRLPTNKQLPEGAKASDVWHIVRGSENLPGFEDNMNFIVHARVEIPPEWIELNESTGGFTLFDITINGEPIIHASQIMQSFNVALFPLAVKKDTLAPQACVANLPEDKSFPQPLQMMFANIWDAYYRTNYTVPWRKNSDGSPVTMNLASNSVIIAPRITQDFKTAKRVELVLIGANFPSDIRALKLRFKYSESAYDKSLAGRYDDSITVEVLGAEKVYYAVPGNSMPSEQDLLRLSVTVAPGALPGGRDLQVINQAQLLTSAEPEAARWFLEIVA